MQKQQPQINVRSSMAIRMIDDQDMAEFILTVEDPPNKQQTQTQQSKSIEIYQNNPISKSQQKPLEQIKINKNEMTSRLDLEIQKYQLKFTSINGQVFIVIGNVLLLGDHKKDQGLLMMTNFRMVFFKHTRKRVQVPFGFLESIKFLQKSLSMTLHLKYSHFWKFQFLDEKVFNNFNTYSLLYFNSDKIKSSFAYNFAMRCQQPFHHNIYNTDAQYARIGILNNPKFQRCANPNFSICNTYPQHFFLPKSLNNSIIKQCSKARNFRRLPVLSYLYKNSQKQQWCIWRSSYYVEDNKLVLNQFQETYLMSLGQGLMIFAADSKGHQRQQFEIINSIKITYMNLPSLSQIKNSYFSMVQNYLCSNRQFIKQIINTKWYYYITNLLEYLSLIINKILNGNHVLIRCSNGFDRSPVICALIMIVLDPFYRTFQGFAILIQKQFIEFGYPFASRLGHKSNKSEQYPTFIQFLDIVSQLIFMNPTNFQFNYKYLSKLSNLIYTNVYGNFITDSMEQYKANAVATQTLSIWHQLKNQITINAYYQKKHGILSIKHTLSSIRLWKEHFWYLTTAFKDSYKIHPLAEDNSDYLNIQCLKRKRQNESLKQQINLQKKQIQILKEKISKLQQ